MSIIVEEIKKCSTVSEYKSINKFIRVLPVKTNPISEKWNIEACFLPDKYKEIADDMANMEVRKDDIWIVSFPKCGTTWTQEMIWMLCNNLDYMGSTKVLLNDRYYFIDCDALFNIAVSENEYKPMLEKIKDAPSPRYIKTHLPAQLLPHQIWNVKPKIIYTARNPKDAAVSFYHHYKNTHCYKGSFEEFMAAFLADQVIYSPIHSHIQNFWNISNEENILFITFEEMKSNLRAVLEKAATFLQKEFSDSQMETLQNHLHVDSMRANPSINHENTIENLLSLLGEEKFDKNYK